jgi:hypothetical protein
MIWYSGEMAIILLLVAGVLTSCWEGRAMMFINWMVQRLKVASLQILAA